MRPKKYLILQRENVFVRAWSITTTSTELIKYFVLKNKRVFKFYDLFMHSNDTTRTIVLNI